jgi:hypothetical protein
VIRLFSTGKAKKQISIKSFLATFFVCVSVVTWIDISTILADEDDPADNMDNTELSFQNPAQVQHANNVATQAALQHSAVIAAKENGDTEEADRLFNEKVEAFTQKISDMRAEGRGWGDIAKELGVHPSFLGLGHSNKIAKSNSYPSTRSQMKSESCDFCIQS